MKMKLIFGHSLHEAEDRTNDFLKGKKNIEDIKLDVSYVGDDDRYVVMVLYS